MAKVWELLETVLPTVETGTSLQVTHGSTVIFTHNQVWFELNQKYTEWGFLKNPNSNGMSVFLALYTNFVANMGGQLWRMYDAITREYNPLNNYDMTESGGDGRKQSKKTVTDTSDNVNGARLGGVTTTKNGSEANTHTQTGNETVTHSENAFDSGLTATARDERTAPAAITDTHSFTGRNDATTYGQDKNSDAVDGVTLTGYTNVGRTHDKKENTEEYQNNVTLNVTKMKPDGTAESSAMGTTYSDGTEHFLTRSGNIGVTTNMQMLTQELEGRRTNLLKEWVHMFIMEYCTYVGSDE